jgi:prophage DNA circulation protein
MADDVITREAYLDGYLLEIEDIEDSFEKSIATYEIPFRDGALLEDMGQNARKIRFKCYFYEEHYDVHRNFLNHLSSKSLYELIHPKYGLMKGRIDNITVKHNDRVRTAEIDVNFIEQWRSKLDAGRNPDVQSDSQDVYERGIIQAKKSVSAAAAVELGSESVGICSKILTAGQSAFSQFTGLSAVGRAYVKKVDSFVSGMEATLTDIANPANSLISTIDFGLDLPGRVIGAIAHTVERYSALYDSLTNAPEKFLHNFSDAMTGLENSVSPGFKSFVATVAALQVGITLASIFSGDESFRDLARVLETQDSFDAAGNYIKSDPTPDLLDVNQIEKSLAVANAMIQTAIDQDRSMQTIKDLTRVLTEHAIQVKIEAEKLVTIHVDNEIPLHLLCLQRGLPYNYAERIVKVNNIPNPNQVKGEVQVYVR